MINKLRSASHSDSGFASLTTTLQRFYPLWLFMAIAMLCWLLATATWLIVSPPLAPQLPPIALSPPKVVNNANALDIFAKSTIATTVQPPPAIKILGVTVAEPSQNSYAILNVNGKIQNYRVNNLLEGNQYKLTKVTHDFIIVTDLTGKTTKIDFGQPLSLDQSAAIRAKALGLTANSATTMTGLSNAIPPNSAIQNPALPNSVGNRLGVNTSSPAQTNMTAQAALGEAANAMQQDPVTYLSNMGVVSVGQGYQVTDAMPTGLRNRLGLQSGDKIVSVNGQSVGQNASQDAQLLQQIQQSGQAQIQVQRGAQTITVRQSF